MRAVTYAKESTEDQREEETPITAQIRDCETFALSNSWQALGVCSDEGIPSPTDERPDFRRMLALADPMNRCHRTISDVRSPLAEIGATHEPEAELSHELASGVLESAKKHLQGGKTEEIELLLRHLTGRVENTGDGVPIQLTFKKPGTKVAQLLAPQAQGQQNPTYPYHCADSLSVRPHQSPAWAE